VSPQGFKEDVVYRTVDQHGHNQSRKSLWRVIRQYITRWQIEETIRYVKQGYGLENARARKYEGEDGEPSPLPFPPLNKKSFA
jgi:hypothetical protein